MSKLAEENEILETLRTHLGSKMLDGKVERDRRISVTVADPVQREVLSFAKKKWGAWHLIAISGVDTQESMAVVYHFDIKPPLSGSLAITLNLRVDVDRDNPKVQTVTDIAGASAFFEREAHDLLGIVFEGHPNLERLILPDDWPEGVYPLRKDFLLEIQKEEAK